MGLYSDSRKLNPIGEGTHVPVGDTIYARITLDTDADVRMFVRGCVATPSRDVRDPSWTFFEDG